jgi:hypothetical protein
VGFGPHRQLLEAIERSIQRDIARNGEILQGGSKALQDLIKDRFEASDGAQNEDLAAEQAGNAEEDCHSIQKPPFQNGLNDIIEEVTPQNVLEGMSRNNLKHSQRHLPKFQKLDPSITDASLRELGASIVKPENLISGTKASQKVFEQVVDIGGVPTRVRVALNAINKLHSIHIRSN